jgi:hypothetical protein
MSKITKIVKPIKRLGTSTLIEEIPNNDSDSEIEINISKPKKQLIAPVQPMSVAVVAPIEIPPIVPIVKEKKKRNLSAETRQKMSDNMKKVRLLKMEYSAERQKERETILKQEEEALHAKAVKKLKADKMRREKVIYQNLLDEEIKKNMSYERLGTSALADSEPEPTPKPKRAPKHKEPVYEMDPHYAPEEEYYEPVYQRPSLNYY